MVSQSLQITTFFIFGPMLIYCLVGVTNLPPQIQLAIRFFIILPPQKSHICHWHDSDLHPQPTCQSVAYRERGLKLFA